MPRFGENWDDSEFPLAYLITIRTFGTWLHGDKRGSVDTHGKFNHYGAVKRTDDLGLRRQMATNMKGPAFLLNEPQRKVVEQAIREVCNYRGYGLYAVHARSNHAHVVVNALSKPEPIADAFKSYATRALGQEQLIGNDTRVWSRGRSRRYLWENSHVAGAIDYVLYCQGDEEFEKYFEQWSDTRM